MRQRQRAESPLGRWRSGATDAARTITRRGARQRHERSTDESDPAGNRTLASRLVVGLLLCLLSCSAAAATPDTAFFRSFEAAEPAPASAPAGASFGVEAAGGPSQAAALTAKPGVGFSGLRSLHYRGSAGGRQQAELFAVNLPVRADTRLSYLIFPVSNEGDLRNPGQLRGGGPAVRRRQPAVHPRRASTSIASARRRMRRAKAARCIRTSGITCRSTWARSPPAARSSASC